jgi:hypothetical protein
MMDKRSTDEGEGKSSWLPFQYTYIYILYIRKLEICFPWSVIDVCCVSKRAHLCF